jgi:hypothetical protein
MKFYTHPTRATCLVGYLSTEIVDKVVKSSELVILVIFIEQLGAMQRSSLLGV